MHARIFTLVAAFTLLGCATQPTQSAYNLGVNAYQAKNYVVAREQWSKAIEAGDTSALNNLGYLLYFGLGGTPDSTRAVALWKRAATAGHSEAQWHLGYAYETGNGDKPHQEGAGNDNELQWQQEYTDNRNNQQTENEL